MIIFARQKGRAGINLDLTTRLPGGAMERAAEQRKDYWEMKEAAKHQGMVVGPWDNAG